MDLDEIMSEMDRVFDVVKGIDPSTEKYWTTFRNYHELAKCFQEELEARQSELNHKQKRELEKAKHELAKMDVQIRERQVKWEARIKLMLGLLSVVGTLAAIVLTGTFEQSTILSAKCLGWIKALQLKV